MTSRSGEHARRAGLRALVAALAIMAAAVLPVTLVGALGPLIQETYRIGDATLGALLALFFGSSTVTAHLGGRLADSVGWRRALRWSAALSTATLLGIAVAGPTLLALVGWLVLGGIALSLAAPTSNLVIAREMPGHRLGVLMGIKQTSIPLSTLFAGLSLPLVALTIGWRWAFVVAAAVPVGAAVVAGRLEPAARPRLRLTMPRLAMPSGPRRPLLLLAVGGGLAAAAANALGAFAVLSAVSSGVALRWAGVLVAVASGVGFVARIALGVAVDRRYASSIVLSAAALGLGGAAFLTLAVGTPGLAIIGTIAAYGAGWSWPGLLHHGIVIFHPADPAAASGVVQVGLSLGSAVGPAAFGMVAERAGFGVAWGVLCALSLAAASTMVAAYRSLVADRSRSVP